MVQHRIGCHSLQRRILRIIFGAQHIREALAKLTERMYLEWEAEPVCRSTSRYCAKSAEGDDSEVPKATGPQDKDATSAANGAQ